MAHNLEKGLSRMKVETATMENGRQVVRERGNDSSFQDVWKAKTIKLYQSSSPKCSFSLVSRLDKIDILIESGLINFLGSWR